MNKIIDDKLKKIALLMDKKQYLEAWDIINKIIDEHPNYTKMYKVYSEKAHILSYKEINQAIECMDKAIALSPNESYLYMRRARYLIENQNFDEACEDLTYTILLGEKLNWFYYTESAYFFRAIAFSHLRRFTEVLSDCSQISENHTTCMEKFYTRDELVIQAQEAISHGK